MSQRQMIQTAEQIATVLRDLGVRHVFGIPGKAIYPLLMALDRCGLSFVLARHESGAGFAATGYGMMNGVLGVAIGTSGPGGTNLLTAAGQAKAYSAPVLFITGHPSAKQTGKPFSQDSSGFGTDLVALFKPVAKFSATVNRVDLLRDYLEHAIQTALTPPRGPVHLNIPMDVLTEETASFQFIMPAIDKPISLNIAPAVDLMIAAKRPLILAGKGVHSAKAYSELTTLAERMNIPVATTPGGKGVFPTHHPLSLGGYGLGGSAAADRYIDNGIDLLISLGSKLTEMSLPDLNPHQYPTQMMQFDWEASVIGKSLPVPTLPIVGDIKPNLDALLKRISGVRIPDRATPAPLSTSVTTGPGAVPTSNRWSAVTAMQTINQMLHKDTVVFGDCGSHTFYAIEHYDIETPGTFFFDDVFGAMGNAIAVAIGAQLAMPEKSVVCLTGDGCMMMHGMELSMAVNARLNMTFIVFNNKQLDMVDKSLQLGYGKSIGSRYAQPTHFAALAESIGAIGFRCSNRRELQEALGELGHPIPRPRVIEVMLPEDEVPALIRKRMNAPKGDETE